MTICPWPPGLALPLNTEENRQSGKPNSLALPLNARNTDRRSDIRVTNCSDPAFTAWTSDIREITCYFTVWSSDIRETIWSYPAFRVWMDNIWVTSIPDQDFTAWTSDIWITNCFDPAWTREVTTCFDPAWAREVTTCFDPAWTSEVTTCSGSAFKAWISDSHRTTCSDQAFLHLNR